MISPHGISEHLINQQQTNSNSEVDPPILAVTWRNFKKWVQFFCRLPGIPIRSVPVLVLPVQCSRMSRAAYVGESETHHFHEDHHAVYQVAFPLRFIRHFYLQSQADCQHRGMEDKIIL